MSHIIETDPKQPDFYLFEQFPKELYPADSIRFRLPETMNTEFLDSCYVLLDDGKVKARAALYNNPHLYHDNKSAFCTGNYESIDDLIASADLLQHIASEAKNKGAEFLIGPMNGSTWDSYRFSTHHEHPNFFLEPYHHLYYNSQFLNAGFQVIAKYFSSADRTISFDKPDSITRENEFRKSGVTFRPINLSKFENELDGIFALSAIAFATNFLYTPISKDTFRKKYAETKKLLDPEFVMLAEDEQGLLIGYLFCINDLFNKNEKSLIVKTAARHPDKKWSGLGHVLLNIIYTKAATQNYKSIIHAFMYEQGTSSAITKDFSGVEYKNYALYGKPL